MTDPRIPGDDAPPRAPRRLSATCERRTPAGDLPVAVEFTFTAPSLDEDLSVTRTERPSLSLALAIDRSGSMEGEKLRAARQAAAGVLDALRDGERFAAVAFESAVATVCDSTSLTEEGRARIRSRLLSLRTGENTALFDGFALAAGLLADSGGDASMDRWVLVLSDGMGNSGLTDPDAMRSHAVALAERGIHTITIGIGEDYQAEQLTALADGGGGEFHHASAPGEIVEVVMGELGAMRAAAVRDLRMQLTAQGAGRWLLLGGTSPRRDGHGEARFDRVGGGRQVHVTALAWSPSPTLAVTCNAAWRDTSRARGGDGQAQDERTHEGIATSLATGPGDRDVLVATRTARLWHAHIMSEALRHNERHDYEQAMAYVRDAARQFDAYVEGLPGMDDLVESMRELERRVGRRWESRSHKEAYVMARKGLKGLVDLREEAPLSFSLALRLDDRR